MPKLHPHAEAIREQLLAEIHSGRFQLRLRVEQRDKPHPHQIEVSLAKPEHGKAVLVGTNQNGRKRPLKIGRWQPRLGAHPYHEYAVVVTARGTLIFTVSIKVPVRGDGRLTVVPRSVRVDVVAGNPYPEAPQPPERRRLQ